MYRPRVQHALLSLLWEDDQPNCHPSRHTGRQNRTLTLLFSLVSHMFRWLVSLRKGVLWSLVGQCRLDKHGYANRNQSCESAFFLVFKERRVDVIPKIAEAMPNARARNKSARAATGVMNATFPLPSSSSRGCTTHGPQRCLYPPSDK